MSNIAHLKSQIDEKDAVIADTFAIGVKKDKEILKLRTVIRDVKHRLGLDIEMELDSNKFDEEIARLMGLVGIMDANIAAKTIVNDQKDAYISKLQKELDRLKNVEKQPRVHELNVKINELHQELENLVLQRADLVVSMDRDVVNAVNMQATPGAFELGMRGQQV
jgi:hypothetical protein